MLQFNRLLAYCTAMRESLSDAIRTLPLPDEVLVILLAMVPIVELRGAIPVALGIFQFGRFEAYVLGVVGNLIPVPIILWAYPPFLRFTERHMMWLFRLLTRLQHSTERRHSRRFDRGRDAALVSFVAIPLPITGAWSGSLAAIVFSVPKKRALPLIVLGVLIAGVVVLLFSEALGLAVTAEG